ncbi:MAG: transcriptional regulator [Planctomycetota bacterium]|nr:MAG: transcriptional regulator [Planctomycetota bacterium]
MVTPEERPAPAAEGLDRLVHEPARLTLLATLSVLDYADFVYLMNATGLTRGNLSSHMSKLEAAGYIRVKKSLQGKTTRTRLSLTSAGRKALSEYRELMQRVLEELP